MITSRPYRDQADLQRLIGFLIDQRARDPLTRWHVGDLVWRMFYSSHFDPAQNVRLWEEDGALVGFGWRYPPAGADLNPGDPSLLPDMMVWAQSSVTEGGLYLATHDANHAETAFYEAHGFSLTDTYGYRLRRSLTGEIPQLVLPPGFMLRTLAGDGEAPARAEAHRLAFSSQAVTDDGYHSVIHAPVYRPDLDLLIIAPDGRIAAFCLGWLDEVNRVALFEPVGTHPDFRRMGLARVVMHEGLRRMQALGMESVLISTSATNAASTALYASLGFTRISGEVVYSRA